MGALAGISGDVWTSISPSTALGSPESATDSGDHIHYFTNTHNTWDQYQGVTVQCSPNGSSGWATVTDYQFVWAAGEIIFNTARGVGTNNFVRVSSGSYFTMSQLDGGHAWKMNLKQTVKDVTTFQASGNWALNLQTIKSATFTIDCYRQDARILNEMITTGGGTVINISGGIIMCQLWIDYSGGKRWQFYGYPTGITQAIDAKDIDKQGITMQSSGQLALILSNTFNTTNVIPM